MDQTDIFPQRIRCLAIATGAASALALFPILFLLHPALLIAGGIIQPRFPTTGKWFVWVGAANLWMVVIVYDRMLLQQPGLQLHYMTLTFSATSVLLVWCSAELIANAINRIRVRLSMPPTKPLPISQGVWIVAVVLNLLVFWEAAGRVLAPSWYSYSIVFYNLTMPLKRAVIVVGAFDISLMRRVIELKHTRARE